MSSFPATDRPRGFGGGGPVPPYSGNLLRMRRIRSLDVVFPAVFSPFISCPRPVVSCPLHHSDIICFPFKNLFLNQFCRTDLLPMSKQFLSKFSSALKNGTTLAFKKICTVIHFYINCFLNFHCYIVATQSSQLNHFPDARSWGVSVDRVLHIICRCYSKIISLRTDQIAKLFAVFQDFYTPSFSRFLLLFSLSLSSLTNQCCGSHHFMPGPGSLFSR